MACPNKKFRRHVVCAGLGFHFRTPWLSRLCCSYSLHPTGSPRRPCSSVRLELSPLSSSASFSSLCVRSSRRSCLSARLFIPHGRVQKTHCSTRKAADSHTPSSTQARSQAITVPRGGAPAAYDNVHVIGHVAPWQPRRRQRTDAASGVGPLVGPGAFAGGRGAQRSQRCVIQCTDEGDELTTH